jgi:transposase-like protein
MNVKYRVTLSDEERTVLRALVARGRPQVREVKRAHLLLAAGAGASEAEIARAVGLSPTTIYRTRRAFVEEGLEAALHDATRPGGRRKLSGKEEALLIATACSAPPAGARGANRLTEPIQVIGSIRPSAVAASAPGARSSTATGPWSVAISVPRAKAAAHSSKSAVAGAIRVAASTDPSAVSQLIS